MRSFAKILVGFILVILLISFAAFAFVNVQALTAEQQDKVDSAYAWLAGQGWGTTTEVNAFTLLGLADYSLDVTIDQGVAQLNGLSKDSGQCWPKTGCTIKDTAFAIIALDELNDLGKANEDLAPAVSWLKSQKKDYTQETGGNWFIQLEILNGEKGTFTITALHKKNEVTTVNVASDRTVSVGSSSCFDVSTEPDMNYWVKIKASCLTDAKFKVWNENTGQNWIANLLYIQDNIFIPHPPITQACDPWADVGESNACILEIKRKCFSTGTGGDACHYESTLWASYALKRVGEQTRDTYTYLLEHVDSNENKPLSNMLLYDMHKESAFAEKLGFGTVDNNKQRDDGHWVASLGESDDVVTALGWKALQGTSHANYNLGAAETWLLNNIKIVSGNLHKWNDAKDTGAVLWAVFSPESTPTTCINEGYLCCAPGTEIEPTYPLLDNTCTPIGYKCASSCTTPPPDTCVGEGHQCCVSGTEIAPLYPAYDDTCATGEVCAYDCLPITPDTCIGEGHVCCVIGTEIAPFYPEFDTTCAAGQVCASSCTTPTEQCGVDRGVCCLVAYAEGIEIHRDLDSTCPDPEICAESCQFDFSIHVFPMDTGSFPQGSTVDYRVIVSRESGVGELVNLDMVDFNTTLGDFDFIPDAVLPGSVDPESWLRITISSTAPNNTYILNISGTSGDLVHTAEIELVVVIDDSDTTQQCTAFVGYTCCAPVDIRSGATTYMKSCIYEHGTVCVLETDCLEAVADRCGYDSGTCCVTAGSNAVLYSNLDDTCETGEVCASSCETGGSQPPPNCADFVGASCCDANRAGGSIYGQLDCLSGQTCSTSCLTPAVTDTCYDMGGTCCEEAASDATRWFDYDGTCSYGQYCASQCAGGAGEGEGGGGFLTFLLWFLGIILLAAIIIAIYLYIKNKGKKEEKIPGLAGFGKMPPPVRPIPSFKRPEAPRGPPIRPRPLPGAPGRLRPRMRPRIGMPRAPLKPGRPPARKIAPIFAPLKPAKPAAKKPAARKAPGKTRKKAATELEKTLKELAKIQKSKLKTTKRRATKKRK